MQRNPQRIGYLPNLIRRPRGKSVLNEYKDPPSEEQKGALAYRCPHRASGFFKGTRRAGSGMQWEDRKT